MSSRRSLNLLQWHWILIFFRSILYGRSKRLLIFRIMGQQRYQTSFKWNHNYISNSKVSNHPLKNLDFIFFDFSTPRVGDLQSSRNYFWAFVFINSGVFSLRFFSLSASNIIIEFTIKVTTQTGSLDYAKEEKKLLSSALLVAVGWRASCRHCWVEKSLRKKNKRQKWNSGNREEERIQMTMKFLTKIQLIS